MHAEKPGWIGRFHFPALQRADSLWALPLAGLGALAGFTAWFSVWALSYPAQLLHGDGWMYVFARRLAAGEALYKPLTEFPFGTCNYPPLPFLLANLAFPLTGSSYAAGRIWSLLATLAVAGLLFVWVRRETGRLVPAVASALAWLGAPYVSHWAPQFRADLPGLALSLAGIYLVWSKWDSRAVYAAAPLFVLALYCKQSYLAAPAAGVLALLVTRPRRGVILASLTLLAGGVPFLVLNAITGGAFWTSLVTTNVNPFEVSRLAAQVADFARTYAPLAVLAAVGLLSSVARPNSERRESPRGTRHRPLIAYVVLALLTMGLAGKAGAWENYFLEALVALCLAGGLGIARMRSSRTGHWLAPALVALQVVLMWHTPRQAMAQLRADAAANQALVPRVAEEVGMVMSEDAGLLVQAGKPVPYYDFQLSQLALAGRWDQSWEVEKLRAGAFPLVVFEGDSRIEADRYGRYTRAYMSALDYGYRLSERVGKYTLYRPAPIARERRASFVRGPSLVGHTAPPVEVGPGQVLSLDVVWQATEPITQSYTSFLHLVDASGQGFAGDDRQPWEGLYATSRWVPGEMVRMSYTLTLPADLPVGLYTLSVGWYDYSVSRLHTQEGADQVPLAVVVVPMSKGSSLPSDVGVSFTNGIRLARYGRVPEAGGLTLVLGWQAERVVDEDLAVFVHLRDSGGNTVSQGDGPPLGGAWPTSLWPVDYLLEDSHAVAISEGLTAGRYTLVVGLYDPRTASRVPLAAGGNEVTLETIDLP